MSRLHTNPRSTAGTWLLALLVTAAFFVVLHLAERDTGHASRMAAINAQMDATEQALQRAAADVCRESAGPGAEVLWTADGDLVCRPALITAEAQP